jgi:hypothetical protein
MPKIERQTKREVEATIQDRVRQALGKMPDVSMYRNHVGTFEDKRGFWVKTGLGAGTSDLVGLVTVPIDALYRAGVTRVGVFTAIELKKPDAHEHGQHEVEQRAWLSLVRGMGGAAPEFITSEAEALDAITRIRGGMLR